MNYKTLTEENGQNALFKRTLHRLNNKHVKKILYHICMLVFSIIMIYPVLWMVMSSFKGNTEIFTNASSLIPKEFLFENYKIGWKGFGGDTFSIFFKNSFIISTISTIGAVLSSVLIAYSFARIKFKGSRIMFSIMLMTLMLPYQIIAIPQFIIYQKMDLINTFWPLILPNFFGFPFFIFLNMQFIRGIPSDMDEAAVIDGCNRYTIFTKIILPLLKPSIVTSTIFSFYWRWEDFFAPLLFLNKPKLYTIPLALRIFADPTSVSNWSGMLAMATLSLVPVLFIFFLFQKYLVEGIATTGIKG